MTTDKTAGVPASVRKLAAEYDAKARLAGWSRDEAIRNAIMADRAARADQGAAEAVKALRKFSDKATPGKAWVNGDTADVFFCDPPESGYIPDSVLVARCATGDDYKRNAVFIAECVNFVRAALASPKPATEQGSADEGRA